MGRTYKKLSQREHILHRPEMYIGSLENQQMRLWTYDEASGKIVHTSLMVNNGLCKIVDEVVVNAIDNFHHSKDPPMTSLSVSIDEKGCIEVSNNGAGIPVKKMVKGIHVPELVFGHLLSGSNFDENAHTVAAGRHGYGAKLTNIFSTSFSVRCVCEKVQFMMSWSAHMTPVAPAEIVDVDAPNVTTVRFTPDYERFGIPAGDLPAALTVLRGVVRKRLWDTLAYVGSSLNVTFNGEEMKCPTFAAYVELHRDPATAPPMIVERPTAKVAVFAHPRPGVHPPVATVNGVCTPQGGTHVDAYLAALHEAIAKVEAKKRDEGLDLRGSLARLFQVVVVAEARNPKFDSQSKEKLVSVHRFPRFPVNDLVKYILELPTLDEMCVSRSAVVHSALNQQLKSSGRSIATTITKLVDATFSTNGKCTLIVTEGDSAKALALASLSSEQRATFGVFPLRGKILNIRNVSLQRLATCKELMDLFTALGLKLGRAVKNADALRYQRLMLMTDQDSDGAHICALVISALEMLWPDLMRRGFLSIFQTPLIKATLTGGRVASFWSRQQFEEWMSAKKENIKSVKYYKGLGTSTTEEGKEYFGNIGHHISEVVVGEEDGKLLDNVFQVDRVAWRKLWVTNPDALQLTASSTSPAVRSDGDTLKVLPLPNFVHDRLRTFALDDNMRAIPHAVDGIKRTQRKILWSLLRRSATVPCRLSQLSGYVSEVSNYHHGEASLQQTMVNMAQDFTGGNNLNLLLPVGQFGTRLSAGSDSAAARYIYTALSPFARLIFPAEDDELLTATEEDGEVIEPEVYAPIIPLLLVNGSIGIGYGFRTNIPPHCPLAVIEGVRKLIHGAASFKDVAATMRPLACGFRGTVEESDDVEYTDEGEGGDGKWKVTGCVDAYLSGKNVTLRVTEIPWTTSIESFRAALASKLKTQLINVNDFSGANHVDLEVKIPLHEAVLMDGTGSLHDAIGLSSTLSTAATVIGPSGTLHELQGDLSRIFEWHFEHRMSCYGRRHQLLMKKLRLKLDRLRATLEFGEDVQARSSHLLKLSDDALARAFEKRGWVVGDDGTFNYLTNRPWSFYTVPNMAKIQKRTQETSEELQALSKSTPQQLWLHDLEKLEAAVKESIKNREASIASEIGARRITGKILPLTQRKPSFTKSVGQVIITASSALRAL